MATNIYIYIHVYTVYIYIYIYIYIYVHAVQTRNHTDGPTGHKKGIGKENGAFKKIPN